jgi:hypothetical protein
MALNKNNKIINVNTHAKKYFFHFKLLHHDIEADLLRFSLNDNNETILLCIEYTDFISFLTESIDDKYNFFKNDIYDIFNELLENLDFYIFGYNNKIKKFTYTNIKNLVYKISNILITYNKNQIKNYFLLKNKIKDRLLQLNTESNEITLNDIDLTFKKIWVLFDCLDKIEITPNIKEEQQLTFTLYDFIFDQNK